MRPLYKFLLYTYNITAPVANKLNIYLFGDKPVFYVLIGTTKQPVMNAKLFEVYVWLKYQVL